MTKIYKVLTEGDEEGRFNKILGYATGNVSDIKLFFNDQKLFSITVEEIKIQEVTEILATQRFNLAKEKKQLQDRIQEIDKQLS